LLSAFAAVTAAPSFSRGQQAAGKGLRIMLHTTACGLEHRVAHKNLEQNPVYC